MALWATFLTLRKGDPGPLLVVGAGGGDTGGGGGGVTFQTGSVARLIFPAFSSRSYR